MAKIAINPTMKRATAAAYSLPAGSVNRDAGRLTRKIVAARKAIVIARPTKFSAQEYQEPLKRGSIDTDAERQCE